MRDQDKRAKANLGNIIGKMRAGQDLSVRLDMFIHKEFNRSEGDLLLGKEVRTRGKFHPSMLVSMCPRMLYYEANWKRFEEKSARSPHSATLLRVFHNGDFMHERYQMVYFYHMGILYGLWYCVVCEHRWWAQSPMICPNCNTSRGIKYKEIPFSKPEFNIVGRSDGIIRIPHPVLLELKSINFQGFSKLGKEGPSQKYIRQVQWYLWANELQEGFIVYEDKNFQNIKDFHIEYDGAYIDRGLSVVHEALEAIKKDVEPARVCATPEHGRACNCNFVVPCFYWANKGGRTSGRSARASVIAKIKGRASGEGTPILKKGYPVSKTAQHSSDG